MMVFIKLWGYSSLTLVGPLMLKLLVPTCSPSTERLSLRSILRGHQLLFGKPRGSGPATVFLLLFGFTLVKSWLL